MCDQFVVFRRDGPLPGSADWTHTGADAGNSLASQDERVKAPVGVLWFGGLSGGAIYHDRHTRPVSPLIVQGRMIVQGTNALHAFDVYTGRLLWREPLTPPPQPNSLDTFPGYDMVAVPDGLYLVQGNTCVGHDLCTGKKKGQFFLPDQPHNPKIAGELLIVSARDGIGTYHRRSGATQWFCETPDAFPLANAVGGGRVYSLESLAAPIGAAWFASNARVAAFSLDNGASLWKKDLGCPASFLCYSETYDILVVGYRSGGYVTAPLLALQGKDGTRLWEIRIPQSDPCIVLDDNVILQNGNVLNLRSGQPKMAPDPLTGFETPIRFSRAYGCNYTVAGRNLITFRSGTAGFYDLLTHSGTANLGGFRSGCRNSLLPANGVLNAPKLAHGCTCGYPIFTSLALINRPEVEMWARREDPRLRRIGINFWAPGDRTAPDGTLWYEYPVVGGPSRFLQITVEPSQCRTFLRHSSWVQGESGIKWVASSGILGIRKVRITVAPGRLVGMPYLVRLHFLEPEVATPGQRVFDVRMQGLTVLDSLDILREAGGPRRPLVKEFENVLVRDELQIEFETKTGDPLLCGLEVLDPAFSLPPQPYDLTVEASSERPVSIHLAWSDPDGPGPYTCRIVQPPGKGTLAGDPPELVYTTHSEARGADIFRWIVSDGKVHSREATVTIRIAAPNVPPTAPPRLLWRRLLHLEGARWC